MPFEENVVPSAPPENHSRWKWKQRIMRLREKGIVYLFQRIRVRLYTLYRENQLGISTRGFIPWYELCSEKQNHDYDPTVYPLLDRLMQYVEQSVSEPFVVDYGAGKGRTIAVAGTYSFKGVIGVELNQELADIAQSNLGKAQQKFVCPYVDIIQENAMDWRFPDEANVVFMFNPFSGDVMQTVLDQIQGSLNNHPRILKILFVYPYKLIGNPLIEQSWLRQETEVDTGTEDHLRCFIYEAVETNQ